MSADYIADRAEPAGGQYSGSTRAIAWLLVALQTALLVGIVVIPIGTDWPLPLWLDNTAMLLVGSGIALGLWAARHLGRALTPLPLPVAGGRLTTRGPYRLMRHPMYTAALVLSAGLGLWRRSWLAAALLGGLVLLFSVKSRWEERHLAATYRGYSEYQAATPRFLPRLRR